MVFLLYIAFNHTLDIMSRLIGCGPHVVVKCNPVSANRLFVAGYPVTSCFKLVSVHLLLTILWRKTRNRLADVAAEESLSSQSSDIRCMHVYAHAWIKNESPHWGSCRVILNWRLRAKGETEDGFEGQTPPCTVGHSLTFHCFHVSVIPFFPSSISISQHLHLIRRDSVSSWPVGTEQQPQWLEDCSSTTTKGRSSSPGSTEMTLGMFQ